MGRPKSKSYEEQLKEKYDGKIENLEPYVNLNTKILHRCNYHNHEFTSSPASVLHSKHGCPLCGKEAHKKSIESRKAYTDEEYKNTLFEKFNGNIVNLEPYKSMGDSILHRCNKHNYNYTSTPYSVLGAEYGCKYCSGEHQNEVQSFSLEKVKQMIFDLVGDEYEIVGKYVNMPTVTQFKHNAKNGEVHYFDMTPTTFFNRGGRCYCERAVNSLVIGYNDIATKRPDLAEILLNKEDAYKYPITSKVKLKWICPDCGEIIEACPSDVYYHRLVCPKCSDGLSYPNKFIYNVLKQTDTKFDFIKREYRPEWCSFTLSNGKSKYGIYDIYFSVNGIEYVVEMDGEFHNKSYTNSKLTIEEIKEIDSIKDKLAHEHNINMIRIDCAYCNENRFQYIKENICNSKLAEIIDLNNVDFDECNKQSLSSLVIRVGKLWNDGYTVGKILDELAISETTVRSYLIMCNNMGLTNYTKEESMNRSRCRKVYCTTLNILFNGATEAQKILGIDRTSIRRCCIGEKKDTKGRTDDERLQWLYYEDYLKSTTLSGVSA